MVDNWDFRLYYLEHPHNSRSTRIKKEAVAAALIFVVRMHRSEYGEPSAIVVNLPWKLPELSFDVEYVTTGCPPFHTQLWRNDYEKDV